MSAGFYSRSCIPWYHVSYTYLGLYIIVSLLGYELPEDMISFLFVSYHHAFLNSHSQRGASIRKCRGQSQGDYVLQTQRPSALEPLATHTHTPTVTLCIWLFLPCLLLLGSSNIWRISADLHWLLTPAIQTNPCSALCNQPCPVRPSASQMTGKQRPTWQVGPDTCEICKVGRNGGEGKVESQN